MQEDQQKQWAQSFKMTSKKLQTKIFFDEKEINSQLDFFKKKLLTSLEQTNSKEIKRLFEKLVKLRAKKLVIFLTKNPDEKKAEKEVQKYFQDCQSLAQFIKKNS